MSFPTDGAGQWVPSAKAAEAVKCFAELWGHSLFDCGPQDYETMTKDILEIMAIPHI